MEIFRPKRHKDVEEIEALAETGAFFKVAECFLNGDLAQIPSDENQRILSLALERSAEYSQDMVIPLTDETCQIEKDHVILQEEKMIRINFRTDGLKQVIESLYNDK